MYRAPALVFAVLVLMVSGFGPTLAQDATPGASPAALTQEGVELVPYTQTREYMKKVTENFARYRYLYQKEVYEKPLTVDKDYVRDQLTY